MSQFPSTQWLMVEIAGGGSPEIARAALDHLLTRYWQPMFVHLRYKGVAPEAAEDLLQDFVIEILDKNLLGVADRSKGKFRTLLLTALDRFAISRHRYNTAAKRAPKSLSSLDAREHDDVAGAGDEPSQAFERAWAIDLLAETLVAMRRQCEEAEDDARWIVFDRRVLGPLFEGAEPPEYAALAEELGLNGEKAAMNLLVTAKRQFARTLRELVREYVTQSGPQQTTAALAASRDGAKPLAGAAARQLAEHTVVQAVEREIAELQKVLAASRSAAESLRGDEPTRANDDPLKSYFWRRLTQASTAAPASVETMLDLGAVVAEGGLEAWVAELMAADVRRLLGGDYPAAGPVGDQIDAVPPNLAVLEHLKEWANVQRFTLSATPQGKLADVLYFLCIAAALVHASQRITGMNDASLRQGFEWLLAHAWLDDRRRAVVEQARAMLTG